MRKDEFAMHQSEYAMLTMSAQYAKSLLRACLMCLMFSANTLTLPVLSG